MSGKMSIPPKPSTDPAVQATHWAYGSIATIYDDRRIVGHTGGGPRSGITTAIDIFPDPDWVVVILMNYDDIDVLNALSGHARRLITCSA